MYIQILGLQAGITALEAAVLLVISIVGAILSLKFRSLWAFFICAVVDAILLFVWDLRLGFVCAGSVILPIGVFLLARAWALRMMQRPGRLVATAIIGIIAGILLVQPVVLFFTR